MILETWYVAQVISGDGIMQSQCEHLHRSRETASACLAKITGDRPELGRVMHVAYPRHATIGSFKECKYCNGRMPCESCRGTGYALRTTLRRVAAKNNT